MPEVARKNAAAFLSAIVGLGLTAGATFFAFYALQREHAINAVQHDASRRDRAEIARRVETNSGLIMDILKRIEAKQDGQEGGR